MRSASGLRPATSRLALHSTWLREGHWGIFRARRRTSRSCARTGRTYRAQGRPGRLGCPRGDGRPRGRYIMSNHGTSPVLGRVPLCFVYSLCPASVPGGPIVPLVHSGGEADSDASLKVLFARSVLFEKISAHRGAPYAGTRVVYHLLPNRLGHPE
jgi:hypothetical protein